MARGRMLANQISESRQVADLIKQVGPWGGILFTWLIAHLDKEGRCCGDPAVLKGKVCPRLPDVDLDIVEKTLAAAHELKLLVWYEADGDLHVAFPGFDKHQPNLRKEREAESNHPDPSAGVTPDLLRTNSGVTPDLLPPNIREVKLSKVKLKKEKAKTTFAADKPRAVCSVLEVYNYYKSIPEHRNQHKNPKSSHVEWKKIKARLAEGYSVEDLKLAIDGCHITPYNMGDNERGEKYNGLKTIMRDSAQIERFKAKALDPNPVVPNIDQKTKRSITAGVRWLQTKQRERENHEGSRSTVICGGPGAARGNILPGNK